MFRCLCAGRSGWRLSVLAVLLTVPGLAGEPADPFGPVGGSAGADPFRAGANPASDDARRRDDRAAMLVDQAVQYVERDLRSASDDALVMDDALWLLNRSAGEPWDIVAKLAGQRWGRAEGESVRDFVAGLDARARGRSDELKTRLEQIQAGREELKGPTPPLDWRPRQTIWLDFVELIILTKSGDDILGRWQQAAAAHEDLARVHRMAYLLAARQSPTAGFDDALVRPLLATARPGPQRIRAATELLTTLLAKDVPDAHPLRIEAWTKLLDDLRASSAPWDYPGYALAQPLAELYRTARARSTAESDDLLATILTCGQWRFFVTFAGLAGIPPVVEQQLLLAKPVHVTAAHNTLGKALAYLASQATMPLWIDLQPGGPERSDPPVSPCAGPWLLTLEKVLSATGYGLHPLGSDLFWIGPPDRLEAAREAYLDGLAKSRWGAAKPRVALSDETSLEFIETPLSQVVEFLSDQHHVSLLLLGDDDPPVTLNLRGVPLHVALTVLTRGLEMHGRKWDWCAERDIIFVGPVEQLEQVAERTLSRLRRWATWGTGSSDVKDALLDDTRMEFIETPLCQVADFLSDMHNVPVRVAEPHRQDPVTLNLRGITYDQALDVLCLKLGLKWDVDGEAISIAGR